MSAPYLMAGGFAHRGAGGRFLGFVTGGTVALQAEEIAEIGWFSPDDLSPLSDWEARQIADVFTWTGPAALRTRE